MKIIKSLVYIFTVFYLLTTSCLNAQTSATSVQPITFQSSKTIAVDADVYDIVGARKERRDREAQIKQWILAKDTVLSISKILLINHKYKELISFLSPFEKLNPYDAVFYEYLGKSYYLQGYYNGAALSLTHSFLIQKNNELIFLIGKSCEEIGEKKNAIKWYKKGKKDNLIECVDALKRLN